MQYKVSLMELGNGVFRLNWLLQLACPNNKPQNCTLECILECTNKYVLDNLPDELKSQNRLLEQYIQCCSLIV